jgi:predicted TPR repeat methyltransferase
VAESSGFAMVLSRAEVLRRESDHHVEGDIYILKAI